MAVIAIDLPPEEAWALGLFEGEGSIVTPSKRGRNSTLIIQMSDEDVLKKFHAIIKFGHVRGPYNYNKNKNITYKPVWAWSMSAREEVRTVLTKWLPYFGERSKQRAMQALARLDQSKKIRERKV